MSSRRRSRPCPKGSGLDLRLRPVVIVGVLVAALITTGVGEAAAHPADFDTLTLDFIVNARGLERVEGAVVESDGPGYEPFPSVTLKEEVVAHVLRAMAIERSKVSVDAAESELYHEVGFVIVVVVDEQERGRDRLVQISSRSFGGFLEERGLDRVKISICGRSTEALRGRTITASKPGRPSSERDRPGCEVWVVERDEPPLALSVESSSSERSGGGGGRAVLAALASLLLLVVVLAIRVASAWRPRGSS